MLNGNGSWISIGSLRICQSATTQAGFLGLGDSVAGQEICLGV
jgi:hypothetical protein